MRAKAHTNTSHRPSRPSTDSAGALLRCVGGGAYGHDSNKERGCYRASYLMVEHASWLMAIGRVPWAAIAVKGRASRAARPLTAMVAQGSVLIGQEGGAFLAEPGAHQIARSAAPSLPLIYRGR